MAAEQYEVLLAEHEDLSVAVGDDIREVEVNGEWAVIEIINKGFMAAWYDNTWKAHNVLLNDAATAREYAIYRAKKISHIEKLKELCIKSLIVIAIFLALSVASQIAQRYLLEPDTLSVPQFHGEKSND